MPPATGVLFSMRPHPRIRKAIKWGGAGAVLLLLVIWVGSGWGYVFASHSSAPSPGGAFFAIEHGQLVCSASHERVFHSASPWIFNIGKHPFGQKGYEWSFALSRNGWFIPLWCPFLLLLVPTTIVWRLDLLASRRARAGRCPTCNYDRAGLPPGSPCPECGKPASAPAYLQ